MLKNSSEGLLSLLMFVPVAGVERRCRLPSQAAFESHSSILRHASDVTRPVRASFLQRKCEKYYHALKRVCGQLIKRSVPQDSSGPASLRLPMPSLGDDNVLSRAEAAA